MIGPMNCTTFTTEMYLGGGEGEGGSWVRKGIGVGCEGDGGYVERG